MLCRISTLQLSVLPIYADVLAESSLEDEEGEDVEDIGSLEDIESLLVVQASSVATYLGIPVLGDMMSILGYWIAE